MLGKLLKIAGFSNPASLAGASAFGLFSGFFVLGMTFLLGGSPRFSVGVGMVAMTLIFLEAARESRR